MSPTTINDYLLKAEEGWYIHLNSFAWTQSPELRADGTPLERISRGWFLWRTPSPDPPSEIKEYRNAYTRTVGYRLPDGVLVDGLEDKITPERYLELSDDEGDEFDRRHSLYEAIREDVQPEPESLDVPSLTLEGRPAPDDGFEWHAKLPTELSTHVEYLHLFPGYLPDFQDAVRDALNAGQHIKAYKDSSGVIKVTVTAAFDPPRHEFRKPLGGGRKRKAEVRTYRSYELRVPYRIEADDRAQGVSEWKRQIREYVDEARTLTVTACGHCEGTGLAGREAL